MIFGKITIEFQHNAIEPLKNKKIKTHTPQTLYCIDGVLGFLSTSGHMHSVLWEGQTAVIVQVRHTQGVFVAERQFLPVSGVEQRLWRTKYRQRGSDETSDQRNETPDAPETQPVDFHP